MAQAQTTRQVSSLYLTKDTTSLAPRITVLHTGCHYYRQSDRQPHRWSVYLFLQSWLLQMVEDVLQFSDVVDMIEVSQSHFCKDGVSRKDQTQAALQWPTTWCNG